VVGLFALNANNPFRAEHMKKRDHVVMLKSMDGNFQRLTAMTVCLLLAGCGTMRSSVVVQPAPGTSYSSGRVMSVQPARTPIPGGSYRVVRGDTLYSIAFRKGVDFRDLAHWNGIDAPYTIWPGQRLTLQPRASSTGPSSMMAANRHVAARAHVAAPVAAAPVFEPIKTPSAGSPPAATPSSRSATAPIEPTVSPSPGQVIAPAPSVTSASAAVVPVAGKAVKPVETAPASPMPVVAGHARSVSGITWRWPAEGAVIKGFNSADAIPGVEISGKPGEPVRAAADGVVVYSGNGLVGYGELIIIKHSDSFLSAYGHNRKRLVKEGQRVAAGQQIGEMGSTGASRNELEFQVRKNGNPVNPLDYLPPH
jgi:lipoprotein NlpD